MTARNGALRRLTALNRLAAAGAVALVLGFTALAANATPPKHAATGAVVTTTATPSSPSTLSTGSNSPKAGTTERGKRHRDEASSSPARTSTSSSSGSSSSDAQSSAPAQTSQPPAQTSQPPVVVSGGS